MDEITLTDLITREEIREWSNVPEEYKPAFLPIYGHGISLMSVFEYVLRRDGGIVMGHGKFSSEGNQVDLQKDVLSRVLAQVPPPAMTRFLSSIATFTGPTPPGVGV